MDLKIKTFWHKKLNTVDRYVFTVQIDTSLYSKYFMFLLHISLLHIPPSGCSILQPPSSFCTHRIAPSSVAKWRFAYSFLIAHQLMGVIRFFSGYNLFTLIGQGLCLCAFLPFLPNLKYFFLHPNLCQWPGFFLSRPPLLCVGQIPLEEQTLSYPIHLLMHKSDLAFLGLD